MTKKIIDKIDKDTAELEFMRFCEGMDLEFDTSLMDDDDVADFDKHKNRFIRAIQKGHLVVNDNDEPVYTPYRKKSDYTTPITFYEKTGVTSMAMDGIKKNQDIKKTYAIMGSLCKVHPNTFTKLAGPDIDICMTVFMLLMV